MRSSSLIPFNKYRHLLKKAQYLRDTQAIKYCMQGYKNES